MTSELGLDKQGGRVGEGRDVAVWGREEHGGVEAACWATLGAVPSMKMQRRLRGGEGGLHLASAWGTRS